MCRFVVYWGEKPRDLSEWLLTKENSLLKQSQNDTSNRPNPDGWGIAYKKGNKTNLVKNSQPAFSDHNFMGKARNITSELLFAHVRRKSHGSVCIENSHPFVDGEWIFMHNGNVPNYDDYKIKIMNKLPKGHKISTNGTTDSEFLFKYFLHWFNQLDDCDIHCVLNIIHYIIYQLNKVIKPPDKDALALNFMLTNGKFIVGYRYNRSLYYANIENGLLISSEPLDSENYWETVPDNHFIYSTNPKKVELVENNVQLKKDEILHSP